MSELSIGERIDREINARAASAAITARAEENRRLQKQTEQKATLGGIPEANIFQSNVAELVRLRATQLAQTLTGRGYTMMPIDREQAQGYGFLRRKTGNAKRMDNTLARERVTIAWVGELVVSYVSDNCWSDCAAPVKRHNLDYLLDLDLRSGLIVRDATEIAASDEQIAPSWAINPNGGKKLPENSYLLYKYENLFVHLGVSLLTNETPPPALRIVKEDSIPYSIRQTWRDDTLRPIPGCSIV